MKKKIQFDKITVLGQIDGKDVAERFEIKNRVYFDESTGVIEIDGAIRDEYFSYSGNGHAAELKDALGQAKDKDVIVNISSPGGSVFEGIEMYNALVDYKGKVTVTINSLAASIATVIASAADEMIISKAANFMIHNPSHMVIGGAKEFRQAAETLESITVQIIDIYTMRSGLKEKQIRAYMDAETFFPGSQAVDLGFADKLKEDTESDPDNSEKDKEINDESVARAAEKYKQFLASEKRRCEALAISNANKIKN